ncbi:MAG: hypothetical protein DRI61_17310, partial [Chloroflexi bacterium]
VLRYRDDTAADRIRVRIWIPTDTPDYCSGWTPIAQSQMITFTHNLGGDVDDYVVGLQFRNAVQGVNQRAYGGLEIGGHYYGAYWQNLTTTALSVFRHSDDAFADEVRVCVSRPDPPDFDSGWVDVAPGETRTITHNLGGNPNLYLIRAASRDTALDGVGINHRGAGGVNDSGTRSGGKWQNLNATTIDIFRRPEDTFADQARASIWLREHRIYLPIVTNNHSFPLELAYDDGTLDTTASWETGKGFAVRFTSPGQAQIQYARYYLQDPRPIEVHVWDTEHNDLITPFQATCTQDGWNDVDLSTHNIVVNGDFYLGFLYLEDYRPTLGVDTSAPDSRSFEVDDAYWEPQGANYMIRAVIVPQ